MGGLAPKHQGRRSEPETAWANQISVGLDDIAWFKFAYGKNDNLPRRVVFPPRCIDPTPVKAARGTARKKAAEELNKDI